MLGERKVVFNKKAGNLGRRQTHIQEPTPKILLDHENSKGRKEKLITVNHLGGGRSLPYLLLCADFL